MHVVKVFLPTASPAFSAEFQRLRQRLTDTFGGVTAFTRAPADGAWRNQADAVERDEIVIVEAMVEALDRTWWAELRAELEARLGEDEILIRAQSAEKL